MTELEKATAIIATTSGVAESVVAEQLKSDAAAETVASELYEPKFKELRDQGDQRATKKTRTEVEKAFKAAGVDDASFADLPAAISALESKAASANPAALTAEQLLKQPAVVSALNAERLKVTTAVTEAETRVRGELETERKQFAQQRTTAAVRAAAEAEIAKLNPNFTKGKEAAQKERLIRELLEDGKFQLDEKGGIQLVDEDGNVLPGKLGNGVAKFEDFVREIADAAYGLPVSQPRDTTGLTQEQIDSAAHVGKYDGPATQDELDEAIIKHQTDPKKVSQLMADFKANVTDKATI